MPENATGKASDLILAARLIERARKNPNLTTITEAVDALAESLRLLDQVVGVLIQSSGVTDDDVPRRRYDSMS